MSSNISKTCFLFYPFFFFASLQAIPMLSSVSQQAQARWAIQDYSEASLLYEELLSQPLDDWQKARVYYNLGTIRLAQHRPLEALAFFQKINPHHLSLPQFGRNLLINEGIGNLQQIDFPDRFGLSLLFLRQAQEAFTQAKIMDCEIQKNEQLPDQSFVCLPNPLLESWNQKTHDLAQEIIKQKQIAWQKEANKQQFMLQQETPLQKAVLQYQEALLSLPPSDSALKSLQSTFDQLTVSKEQTAHLQSIQSFLKKSVQALDTQQPLEAQFFLLAGFSRVENLLPQNKLGSADLLKKALDQSKRALQLAFLVEWIEKKEKNPSDKRQILSEEQQEVLLRAKPFIPTVLVEQKAHFSLHHCQQYPWEQVIPLFDQGYQIARLAREELNASSFSFPMLIGQQERTIQYWERALSLLLRPPPVSEENPNASIKETLRLLQEMYQEDQSLPEQPMKELHSW